MKNKRDFKTKLNKKLYGLKNKNFIPFSTLFPSCSRSCKIPRTFPTPSLFESSPSSNHLFDISEKSF